MGDLLANMNDSPESEYKETVSREHRAEHGQFFTPFQIAEVMAKWVLDADVDNHRVLDPAVGAGVFPRALSSHTEEHIEVDCFDIDKKILEKCKDATSDLKNVEYFERDFLSVWGEKYTGIICNPPYLKFHDYDNEESIKQIENNLKISLSGYSNIYSLFILKCLHQLEDGGRMAFIVPTEFMNTGYGKIVKKHILESRSLMEIVWFDESESVFDGVMVTSCILLFEKASGGDEVKFTYLTDDWKNDIQNIFESDNGLSTSIVQLDPMIKWSSYKSDKFELNDENICQLKRYGAFKRGIATGANDFFVFNKSKAEKHGIYGENFLKRCICKSSDIQTDYLTDEIVQDLVDNDRNVFLLDAEEEDADHTELAAYLERADDEDLYQKPVRERYLVKQRKPWHRQEQRPRAKILASVFNRNRIKFIRNKSGALNLTTFHGFYANTETGENKINLLFAYLLTDISREIIRRNQRTYAMGLAKFEPGDLNEAYVVKLDEIPKEKKKQILDLEREYSGSSDDEREKTRGELNAIFKKIVLKSKADSC